MWKSNAQWSSGFKGEKDKQANTKSFQDSEPVPYDTAVTDRVYIFQHAYMCNAMSELEVLGLSNNRVQG